MASVQKIALSASRDIDFNKLVLRQFNVHRAKAGDGDRPGLRLHHQTMQAPGEKRAAGDRLTPVGLRPPSSKHGGLLLRASHRTGHAGPHPALWID